MWRPYLVVIVAGLLGSLVGMLLASGILTAPNDSFAGSSLFIIMFSIGAAFSNQGGSQSMNPKMALLAAIAVTSSSSGCSEMKSNEVSVHGVTYDFPMADISAAVLPPDGNLFVRLEPSGENFHLILDELSHNVPNQDSAIPTISRVNDVRFEKFTVKSFPSGPVICGHRRPHFNCGMRIEDGEVKWSVLFDRDQLDNAETIRAHAKSIIQNYRSREMRWKRATLTR